MVYGPDDPIDDDPIDDDPCAVPGVATFADFASGSVFFADIEWLACVGITTGWGDGTFRPGAFITREAMAAFLYAFAGSPDFDAPAVPTFADVPASSSFCRQVEWLVASGITTGWDDGTFRPGLPITREATAAFLHRASVVAGGNW